ncbi:MAG: response regulator [Planctomycetota bacterium]|nr:response regulator [Planctomycetota bacterium]
MNGKPITILAIEDSVADAHLLRSILNGVARFDFDLRHESQLADGLSVLSGEDCDVVLLDLMLPDSMGLETVDRVHLAAPYTPIIVLTNVDDEVNAFEAVRRGAQDYLFKSRLDGPLVSRAIMYAIERKRAERVLNESIVQRQILEAEVLKISTHEQQRISQDLHDSVGQQLTGLSYMASSLAKRLARGSLPEAADAQMIVEGIQTALMEVRRAIRGLAPVDVDAEGLMVALKRLAASTGQRCGVECRFTCHDPVRIEDNDSATHLYRIAQEALHNAVKHSGAGRVLVSLCRRKDHLVLEVSDDGTGLNGEASSDSGMGLHIMHYRARMIGATLNVSSAAEHGTTITCTVKQEFAHAGNNT